MVKTLSIRRKPYCGLLVSSRGTVCLSLSSSPRLGRASRIRGMSTLAGLLSEWLGIGAGRPWSGHRTSSGIEFLKTGKKGKDPHPQDKSKHLDLTKDPRLLYYKTPPPVHFTTKKSVVRPFSVSLVRTKSAFSKTGRFLSKAEVLGVGGLFPAFKKNLLRLSFAPKMIIIF